MDVLTLEQIRPLVPLEEAVAAMRAAFVAYERGAAVMPFPWHLELPEIEGEVHVKGATLGGHPYFAVKLASGSYRTGTHGGLVVVLDAATALPHLLLLDDGWLTDVRTGAAGAVAADALARADVDTVAVIGTGVQAYHQMAALLCVRRPRRLVVCGRDPGRAAAFAERARALHTWDVTVATAVPEAVATADVVVTVTAATAPVLRAGWLSPGVHVTAVGSDAPHKRELDPDVLTRADRIAVDDLVQSRRLGELKGLDDTALPVVSLGALLAGTAPGRTSDADVTVADLTGLGVQDTAIANVVARRLSR